MVYIRTDANEQIGTGHVMRCLSIAKAFAEKGETVQFITADHRGDGLIDSFDSICLNTVWTDLGSELKQLEALIKKSNPSMLLIDSYYVTEKFFSELRKLVYTVYLDDLNAAYWDVDCLINYNIFAEDLNYSKYNSSGTKLLLSTRYAPLRKEFRNIPRHIIRRCVKDVLVSAGGADPERITEKLIREICPEWPETRFHFVVGSLNPRIKLLSKLAKDNHNVILHINERHMADLMSKCDMAISAAGTTLYELCAAGVPTITYVLADNQADAEKQFSERGVMLSAGDCRKDAAFISKIANAMRDFDFEKRQELSSRMQILVDGRGAERIANKLIISSEIITVVPAAAEDFEDYYSIRCGESDVFWMGYDNPPAREMMEKVFLSRVGENILKQFGDKRIYMIKRGRQNVGFIQFTLADEGVEFGYSILDDERGKGYGSAGLKQAVELAKEYGHCFVARIRDDNIASQKVIKRAGFDSTDDVEMRVFPHNGIVTYRKYVLNFN